MRRLSRFLADPAERLAPADRAAFARELAVTNLAHVRVLAAALVVVAFGLIAFVDPARVIAIPEGQASFALAMHVLLVVLAVVFLRLTKGVADPGNLRPLARRFHLFFRLFALAFTWSAFVLVFRLTGNVFIHHIAIFTFAFFIGVRGRGGFLLYLVDAILFCLTIHAVRPGTTWDYDISGVVAVLLAWLASRLVLSARVKDFVLVRQLAHANADLSVRNEELFRLNSEKNEFLGIAAHDLKNPLNVVSGYAETLLEDGDVPEDERREILAGILSASRRMFELVKNLLDVNAIERGELRLSLAPADLRATALAVAEGYRAVTKSKSQTPLVEASTKGGRIVVRVFAAASHAVLEVEDDGPGLTAADQSKLFGKFSRLSARPTGGEHSTGLGLLIVKKLTEAMGGEIRCESEAGAGARFIAAWPRIVS